MMNGGNVPKNFEVNGDLGVRGHFFEHKRTIFQSLALSDCDKSTI